MWSLLMLAACHRYEPVTAATVANGSSVAVSLTDYGTANLGRLLGMGVGTVEGNLVSMSDSAYTLAVQVVRQRNGVETFHSTEAITYSPVGTSIYRVVTEGSRGASVPPLEFPPPPDTQLHTGRG